MIVLRSRRPRSSYRSGLLTKVRFSIKTQFASANGDAGSREVCGWPASEALETPTFGFEARCSIQTPAVRFEACVEMTD